ncbi:MAG: DUF2971 domain-containing protein [Spirochaetia bacterium]|nr:DUF2971 domain-containing protein [Spirochaetia bacterium]
MNKSIWFTSLAGLNDKSEYASSELYYNKKIINEFHHERVSAANRRFILSFSELADDLNQWRLYGDNGTGVCLEFDFKSPEFLFGQQAIKIIPGNIIYTNDFFNILKNLHEKYSQKDIDIEYRDLEILKHFIKNTDYENEKEYRLIIYKEKTSVKRNWYLNRYNILNSYQQIGLNKLPITLKNIIVGPKCSERDLNIGQLKLFLQDNPIYKNNQQVKVNESEISHYR